MWGISILRQCNVPFFSLLTLKAALVPSGRKSLVVVANVPVTVLCLIAGTPLWWEDPNVLIVS